MVAHPSDRQTADAPDLDEIHRVWLAGWDTGFRAGLRAAEQEAEQARLHALAVHAVRVVVEP